MTWAWEMVGQLRYATSDIYVFFCFSLHCYPFFTYISHRNGDFYIRDQQALQDITVPARRLNTPHFSRFCAFLQVSYRDTGLTLSDERQPLLQGVQLLSSLPEL